MLYFVLGYMLLAYKAVAMCCSFVLFVLDEVYLLKMSFLYLDYQMCSDWLGMSFIFLVLLISSQVVIYSSYYMTEEVFMGCFMYMLLGFILSMIMLIVSSDGLSLMLGWDGLGITSHLLIMFL